jgi:hypothetical protein
MSLDSTVLKRLNELVERGRAILANRTSTPFRERVIWRVSKPDAVGWCTNVASLLQRTFGESSVHYKSFEEQRENFSDYEEGFRRLQAVLIASKDDYEGGYLFNVRGLVKAEVLDDALVQAATLLSAGYKDPACVLIGVSLEVAIKDLIQRASLPVAKLDAMNATLCKAGTYNVGKQKQVTAWADLRNKAAHGDWLAYSAADIEDMHRGVQRFVADYL